MRIALVIVCAFFLLALPAAAQAPVPGPPSSPTVEDQDTVPTPEMTAAEREQAKKINQERQDDLKKDTDKLLQLATELKQAVDKSNENLLSLDVVRKADQIEKLAKSVKEKMKGQ